MVLKVLIIQFISKYMVFKDGDDVKKKKSLSLINMPSEYLTIISSCEEYSILSFSR